MLLKRIFDLCCAICGLVILAPLLILIGILIKVSTHGDILFRQIRVGKNEKPFIIFKFRTMVKNAEELGSKLTVSNDIRITKIGIFLRKTKIDELPQLINVLIGDMSLVGPRPEVPKYVAMYPLGIKELVLSIRPGITDWASIQMIDENKILASSLDPEAVYINQILPEKLAYAIKYIKDRTFLQDFMIILTTIVKIFRR